MYVIPASERKSPLIGLGWYEVFEKSCGVRILRFCCFANAILW